MNRVVNGCNGVDKPLRCKHLSHSTLVEKCGCKRRGHLSCIMTTHAIGNSEKVFGDDVRVFVLRANIARVSCDTMLQQHHAIEPEMRKIVTRNECSLPRRQ